MTAKLKLACLAGALCAVTSTGAFAGARVDAIKARGELICGVNTGLGGFSIADSTGKWVGLDVDICRAVAASLLGDGNKVKFVPLNAQQRFTAVQSGEVDLCRAIPPGR
jgi:general L-amino acid transport system substrate-binding protein